MLQKILILTSWYPTDELPQLGIFFRQQAILLSEKYDVKVAVLSTKNIGKKKAITQLFLSDNVKSKFIFSDKFDTLDINTDDYIFLYNNWRINKIINSSVKKIYQLFTNWKPDIIHAHDTWLAGVIANNISSTTNIPFVLTCHSPFSFNNSNQLITTLIREAIIKTNQLITVSQQDKRNYESLVEPTLNPITVGNYIDTEIFNPKNKKNSNNSIFKITQISRPFKIKDIPTFLKAISYLVKNFEFYNTIEVVLILSNTNGGYNIEKIKNQALELGIDMFLNIKCNISNNEVANELATSNVYVSTSFYETFGVTIAEAIAMGIPTIVVDNGASNDFVQNNVNCLTVEMGDYKKIAHDIYKIYKKEVVLNEVVMHQSIASKYAKDKYLSKLESIYSSVLAKHIHNKN